MTNTKTGRKFCKQCRFAYESEPDHWVCTANPPKYIHIQTWEEIEVDPDHVISWRYPVIDKESFACRFFDNLEQEEKQKKQKGQLVFHVHIDDLTKGRKEGQSAFHVHIDDSNENEKQEKKETICHVHNSSEELSPLQAVLSALEGNEK